MLVPSSAPPVVRGSIRNVSHNAERQTSLVEVSEGRVYRQRSGVFERHTGTIGVPGSSSSWRGHIHTLLQCHVKPGGGEFLFTGTEHFGEAWLGCAPRYKDFMSLYQSAWAARQNPCEFPLDWGCVPFPSGNPWALWPIGRVYFLKWNTMSLFFLPQWAW